MQIFASERRRNAIWRHDVRILTADVLPTPQYDGNIVLFTFDDIIDEADVCIG